MSETNRSGIPTTAGLTADEIHQLEVEKLKLEVRRLEQSTELAFNLVAVDMMIAIAERVVSDPKDVTTAVQTTYRQRFGVALPAYVVTAVRNVGVDNLEMIAAWDEAGERDREKRKYAYLLPAKEG